MRKKGNHALRAPYSLKRVILEMRRKDKWSHDESMTFREQSLWGPRAFKIILGACLNVDSGSVGLGYGIYMFHKLPGAADVAAIPHHT